MANISKYQTASGTTLYTVRYRTPDRRQTQKRGFVIKRDAQAFAATVETSKLRGEYVSVTVGRTTVGTLGPAWLARQRGHMKPTSFHACENVWRNRVAPRWADVRIADVRYTDVATWVAELSAIRGPSLVRVAYSVLARILDDAVKDRMLAANPARGVKLPKLAPARNVYLTASQLDSLATEAGAYRSLVLLLGVGGLRWGEAIALRVCDIDFLRRRVELHRNIVYVDREFIVGSLKSNKNRTVVVPAFVMEALAATAAGRAARTCCGPRRTAATSVPLAASPGSLARWHAAMRTMRRSPA